MDMNSVFKNSLSKILNEVFNGPPENEAYILNPGDPGLLKQLKTITAKQASTRPMEGKTTIASHMDHVLYGLTLLNRWANGEKNPWADADWNASWKRTEVNEHEWKILQEHLTIESTAWQEAFSKRKEWDQVSACGAISSAAHTAYHLGAIRQIIAALANR